VALATQALCLRKSDFGESDLVVHLLTPRTGRITAIAKGARRSTRRFPGTLDFFNVLRVEIATVRRAGPMARLEHARLVHAFAGLRTDPARFALASYLLELLGRLARFPAKPLINQNLVPAKSTPPSRRGGFPAPPAGTRDRMGLDGRPR